MLITARTLYRLFSPPSSPFAALSLITLPLFLAPLRSITGDSHELQHAPQIAGFYGTVMAKVRDSVQVTSGVTRLLE